MAMTHVSRTNTEMSKKLKNNETRILKMFAIGDLDNKLSIHFGEDKTKSILFASKRKIARKLDV